MPSIGRRLLVIATAEVAVILGALVVAFGIFAFSSYVGMVGADLRATMLQIHEEIPDGVSLSAVEMARSVANRYLRGDVLIVFVDGAQRVSLYRSSRPDTPPEMLTRQRGDFSGDPKPRGPLAQPVLGLAYAFGLQWERARIDSVDVIVRPNDIVLFSAVDRFILPLIVALIFALMVAYAIARILTTQMLRPLLAVTAALERFASGDLTPQPIGADPRQEFGRLAVAYNGAIEQMERAFAERERANASMRQFIADAGHQLRTPLTVIRGFLGILLRGELRLPSDRERILATMSNQTQIMGSLIEKLMLLEQWESVDSTVARPIDVAQLVSDVAAPIAEANADRLMRIEARPGPLAAIDPGDLTHAVTNLLDNALKYTHGTIDVGVRTENGRVAVDVADEGPGIDSQAAVHVFDRFYRGDNRDIPGSGLGLAIAKRAIERAGGTLTLESDPGTGSRFTITLPRIDVTAAI
ncbi:MAG: HAMP domain-containing sensor histidine kinase [Vulcanimicrobiaceae bacterium]|jgi:two-component system OmpR family sensor kinase